MVQQDHFHQNPHTLSRYAYTLSWARFFKIAVSSGFVVLLLTYFFQPLLFLFWDWFLVFTIWAILRYRKIKTMNSLEAFKIPDEIWTEFRKQNPQIRIIDQNPIEEAFKDYLALHLIKRQAYAMPSHSVDALWHLLLEKFPEFYQRMCQKLLGFELIHRAHVKKPSKAQKQGQQWQLLNTWQASCRLHHLDPKSPQTFPRLFQIDKTTQWNNGLVFNMLMIMALYDQFDKQDSNNTSSCSSSTSSGSANDGFSSDTNSNNCGDVHSSSGHGSDSDSGSDSSSSCSSCSSCGGGGGD